VKLERETLLVMDDKQRIAFIETKTIDKGSAVASPAFAQRYQLANHLGSASLELDEVGKLISYEEYSPYGNTTYQVGRSAAEVSLKRYRFTGKERDEENGFTYHGARYYAPWLGRWISTDPVGQTDGPNPYVYVADNPIRSIDMNGRWGQDMHFYGTYWTARLAGFSYAEALQVALGAQALDDIKGNRQVPGMEAPSAKLGVVLGHWSRGDIMSGANFLHSLAVRPEEAEAITKLGTKKQDLFLVGVGLHHVEDLRPHANATGISTPGHEFGLTERGNPSSPVDSIADFTAENPNLALNTIAHVYRILGEYKQSIGESAPETISRRQRQLLEKFVLAEEWNSKTKNETIIEAVKTLPGGTSQEQINELFGAKDRPGFARTEATSGFISTDQSLVPHEGHYSRRSEYTLEPEFFKQL
jgi:RHS repeat-associated protein